MKYIPPKFQSEAFNCPYCDVYAHQVFGHCLSNGRHYFILDNEDLFYSLCRHCNTATLWRNEEMIYPMVSNAPLPYESMPPEVKKYMKRLELYKNTPLELQLHF